MSDVTGIVRGTMGFDALEDGIPRVVCIVGLFAVPEMLNLIVRGYISNSEVAKAHDVGKLIKGVKQTFQYLRSMIRGALIGITIGTLPAAGSTVSCLLSYSRAERNAKPDQCFGEGEPEGVVAAETSNNASEGGAMAILMALGIPGSGSTAILVAGFMMHGLVPGPRLFQDNASLVYGLISANLVQMLFLGFIALFVAIYLSRIVFIPTKILAPSLIVIMAMGAYSVRFLWFDVYLLFFIGVLGWFLKRYDFPTVSFIIGYILGGSLDMEFYRYAALFGTDLSVFIERPITAALALLTVGTIVLQIYAVFKRKPRAAQ
jgi:putative tricarboxylic transport membrane protein